MTVDPRMLKLCVPSAPMPMFPKQAMPRLCGSEGCSEPIVDGETQVRHPFHCSKGHPNFRSRQMVSMAVVLFGCKIMLVKRGREPGRLRWCAPGGLVEWGDNTRQTAHKEFGQEVFGLPPTHELNIPLTWSFLGDKPDAEGMLHMFAWTAQWPSGTDYYLPERVKPNARLPRHLHPEVVEARLFSIDRLPKLAFNDQIDFFEQALDRL